jgi:ribosomal protein L4
LEHKDSGTERAVGNLQNVRVVNANYLNVYDIMNADTLVISEKALTVIKEWLAPSRLPAAKVKDDKKTTEHKAEAK